MPVRVEFYGIPRTRVGVDAVDVVASNLREALGELKAQFPEFDRSCLDGTQLREGFVANVNGRSFTSDPAAPLTDNDCLIILSADAGG